MIEFLVYILAGLGLGALAGLVPGMHPNLVGVLALGFLPVEGALLAIITMLVSSQFFELLRLTFLFVPEESNVLAAHPVFKFVSEGKGLIALRYLLVGLLAAFLFAIIASPVLVEVVPVVIIGIRDFVPYALIFVAVYLIVRERSWWWAAAVFLLAGAAGWFGLQTMNQPLLVLLTGFFALPILIELRQSFPKQIVSERFEVEKPSVARGMLAAFASSLFLVFLPAVGPAQASVFSRGLLKKTEDFLVAIGAISGFDIVFSMILLYTIGKARVGILEEFGKYFSINFESFVMMLVAGLAAAVLGFLVVMHSGRYFARLVPNMNYRWLSIIVIAFLVSVIAWFDLVTGLVFFAAAGSVGILANKKQVSMTHCMGCLIIPTLIYYFIL